MTYTDAQRATLARVPSTGFHLNTGMPCECADAADYTTRTEYAYSDTMVFHHRCLTCENRFSTWIEG